MCLKTLKIWQSLYVSTLLLQFCRVTSRTQDSNWRNAKVCSYTNSKACYSLTLEFFYIFVRLRQWRRDVHMMSVSLPLKKNLLHMYAHCNLFGAAFRRNVKLAVCLLLGHSRLLWCFLFVPTVKQSKKFEKTSLLDNCCSPHEHPNRLESFSTLLWEFMSWIGVFSLTITGALYLKNTA